MSEAGRKRVRPAGRGVGRLARVGMATLLAVGGATGAMASGAPAASADSSDGSVTVQVLRDFFGTGVINATMDTPQQGMSVDVADAAGHHVIGITDATGEFVVPSSTDLVGGQYRVDVSVPQTLNYLRAAPASTKTNHFDSFTTFVDVTAGKKASVITGVWNPADYTTSDHKYYVPVQTPAVKTSGAPSDPDGQALVAVDPAARNTCTPPTNCPAILNTQSEVGTTWGLAYDKNQTRIFQSAFAKRYTVYGPDGGGAIYTTSADGSSAPTLFATVPDAAPTGHGLLVDMRKDPAFVDVPGKESVGGVALSEDGKTLYAVNLNTRSLVSFDATGKTASAPLATVPIPDPGCAANSDWRPFAVNAHDAKLYVGGVCDAESTQQRGDLKAVVYTYDGSSFSKVLTQGLDYQRGQVINGVATALSDHWNPWNTSLSTWDQRMGYDEVYIDPQPELASLAFTRDGSMILGFRDRFMDVIGAGGLDPRPGNNTAEQGMSGGAIDMACSAPNGYDWEGTGDCPNNATYADDGHKPAGVVQYFPGDFFDPNHTGQGEHEDASQGSVAYVPQQQWVVSTELDPALQVSSNGLGYYDVKTGEGPGQNDPANGYQFIGPNDNAFGKAGGLGDIAYTAANAPIQIGNYVWFDGDHNGIQDPHSTNEVPLYGATVNLLDANGKQVATTTTDKAGEYYFGGVGAAYQLTPGAKYTVEFDTCTAKTDNVPSQPAATDLRFTLPLAGTDRAHDSNVVPPTTGQLCDGFAPVTAPAEPGGVDHTIDAGVYIPPPVPPSSPPPSTSSSSSSTPPTTSPSSTRSTIPTTPWTTPTTPTASSSGTLAKTGLSDALPELITISVLLLCAGAAIAWGSRHRRVGRH